MQELQYLWHVGLAVEVPRLERTGSTAVGHGLKLVCDMWDLLGPGIKPVSSTLGGGFLITEPPEKTLLLLFK